MRAREASTLRHPPNASSSSSRPNMPKASSTTSTGQSRHHGCDFNSAISKTPPVNTSERQCASTSIDWRSVPRGRPRDQVSSAFQRLDQRVPWRSKAVRRSKTLDEVRASTTTYKSASAPRGRGHSMSVCATRLLYLVAVSPQEIRVRLSSGGPSTAGWGNRPHARCSPWIRRRAHETPSGSKLAWTLLAMCCGVQPHPRSSQMR